MTVSAKQLLKSIAKNNPVKEEDFCEFVLSNWKFKGLSSRNWKDATQNEIPRVSKEDLEGIYLLDLELDMSMSLSQQDVRIYGDSANRYNFVMLIGKSPGSEEFLGRTLSDQITYISFASMEITVPVGFKHYIITEYGNKFLIYNSRTKEN